MFCQVYHDCDSALFMAQELGRRKRRGGLCSYVGRVVQEKAQGHLINCNMSCGR